MAMGVFVSIDTATPTYGTAFPMIYDLFAVFFYCFVFQAIVMIYIVQ